MIGENLPHHPQSDTEARAFAAAIAALRAEIECIDEAHKPQLDYLKEQADACRAEREEAKAALAERMESLRARLAEWLERDPDGSLKDGTRIVATLARKVGKPQIHAAQLPPEYLSLQPNLSAINAALAAGKTIPGVSVPISTVLRVS